MAEKNILVNRGIPPGTSVPGRTPYFGTGWGKFSSNMDMTTGASGGLPFTMSVDGAPVGGGHATAQNPVYLMQEALNESVFEGNGWLPYDAYQDLGLNFWSMAPFQIFEIRQDMAAKLDEQRKQKLNSINAQLSAAGVAHSSIETINSSLKYVQQKLTEWENTLAASVARLMQFPAKDYLSRTLDDIIADLKKIDEYDVPAAIDRELAAFTAACETISNLNVRDTLALENANLVDSRSTLQAIAQAKLMASLTAQQQGQALAQQPLFDMAYLSDKEGGLQTTAYVPMDHGVPLGNSGVTLGAGIDLGSKTAASLLSDGVSPGLAALLGEYTALRGEQALNKLRQKPLNISEAQAKEITHVYFELISTNMEKRVDAVAGAGKFRSIPYNTRTAIIDLSFQYGENLAGSVPKTWGMITSGNWKGVVQELNNFGDDYPTRRKSEAKLIQGDIDRGLLQ